MFGGDAVVLPMMPVVALRFRVSGLLGAAALVSLAVAVLLASTRVWGAAIVFGALGALVSAVAALNYLSQVLFTAWWLAPVSGSSEDETAQVKVQFRAMALRSAAFSLFATLVCVAVSVVAHRFGAR